MSATILNEVRPGFYLDSVALMRLSREIAGYGWCGRSGADDGHPVQQADHGRRRPPGRQSGDGGGVAAILVLGILAESPAAAATRPATGRWPCWTHRGGRSGTPGGGSGAAQCGLRVAAADASVRQWSRLSP